VDLLRTSTSDVRISTLYDQFAVDAVVVALSLATLQSLLKIRRPPRILRPNRPSILLLSTECPVVVNAKSILRIAATFCDACGHLRLAFYFFDGIPFLVPAIWDGCSYTMQYE